MGKRLKIALNYTYNESWIGGTYYIENLIKALNTLNEDQKPIIYIISESESYKKLKERLIYPHLLHHKPYGDRFIFLRYLNRFLLLLFKSSFLDKLTSVKAIFPYNQDIPFLHASKKIFWIPDFQEHYLPFFFSDEEITFRKSKQSLISTSNGHLILSSNNAFLNFKEIYPNHKVATHVLPFAVDLPSISNVNFKAVKKEYNLIDEYYVCANQFWVHKDHKTLIKAIYQLKQKGIVKVVYLTGKTEDYRFPKYFQEIKNLIKEYHLEKQIIILGFLDRAIQLSIIKNAKAIIQPSLFEGWSTVIEDAKALNQFIIASDIAIHKEQLESYPNFVLFEKQNPKTLTSILEKLNYCSQIVKIDYNKKILEFGSSFLDIIKH